LILLLSGISLSSCSQQPVKKTIPTDPVAKDWNQTIPGSFSGQSKTVFDSTQLTSFIRHYPEFKSYADEITSFYRKRNYAYAWFDKGLLIEQAGNLSNRISNLKSEGVYKVLPYQNVLDSLIYSINTDKKQSNIALELMLTSQYFVFSKLAWQGMNNAVSKSVNWFVPRKKVDYNQYLDSLLKTPAKLTADEPVYRQYELLKNYLRKYRKLDSLEKWQPIILENKSFKPGDSSATIALIKKRLYQLEDYHGDASNRLFNSELTTAVKHFQQRHGLAITGLLNNATLTELNVPLKSRIKQILVNMERSRWLPVSLKDDYLAVNIPEFKLHVYHADSLLWSCDVVVGQTVHQTTIFYGEVKYVVFSPYWNIPPGILRNEIIPGMKKNSNYIAAHNMEITGYNNGLPIVRQKPGPENSLGLVKFLFPNSYNIYLHDTPSKSLFGESSRAFSHGCIRIKEPVKLAGFLLQKNSNWNADKIRRAMHSGKEQYVNLKDKVPVFIAYFTAFTDRNNTLNFRKDIYNRDGQLASMIISGKGEY